SALGTAIYHDARIVQQLFARSRSRGNRATRFPRRAAALLAHPHAVVARSADLRYGFGLISSISASSSWLSLASLVLAFCPTCSGLVAPAITLATVGLANSPLHANWSRGCSLAARN